jgi:hypothetical protein
MSAHQKLLRNLNYEDAQLYIEELDREDVARYNDKKSKNPDSVFRVDMRPCPFEGDIKNSRLVILLANPGNDSTTAINDHIRSSDFDGWPFFGLHDNSPRGMKDWWHPRLKQLKQKLGIDWQTMSHKVAALQINPWASTNFDSDANFRSRELMFDIARSCAERDALFIVMRARKLWDGALKDCTNNLIYTKSPRCSFVTEGNVQKEDWDKIIKALR